MKRVELATYENTADCLTEESRTFSVPFAWLENFLANHFDISVSEFLDKYTWDESEIVLNEAKKAGILNKEAGILLYEVKKKIEIAEEE